jgi:tetratricopeptide (TPR) repeat protein
VKALLLVLLLLAACGGPSEEEADPMIPLSADPTPIAEDEPASARNAPTAPASGEDVVQLPELTPVGEQEYAPIIRLSVNGSVEPEVERGAPIVVTLSPAGTIQAAGLTFIERSRTDDLVVWQATAPEETGAIVVRAESGGLSSDLAVRIVDPVPGNESGRARLACDAAMLAGDFPNALEAADERLGTAPEDVPALECRGDALFALGRNEEAAAAYRRALLHLRPSLPPGDCTPDLLERKLFAAQGDP